jgi:hypothetical protein
MQHNHLKWMHLLVALLAIGFPALNTPAQTRTLRIVSYNIEDDIDGRPPRCRA